MVPSEVIAALRSQGIELPGGLPRPVHGGSINRALRLDTATGCPLFLKLNAAESVDLFEAEADGLAALADAEAAVPDVVALGCAVARPAARRPVGRELGCGA